MNLVETACNSDASIDMPDWTKRVVAERAELDKKIEALTSFVETEAFSHLSERSKRLLKTQLVYMREYSHILSERLTESGEVGSYDSGNDLVPRVDASNQPLVCFKSEGGKVAQLSVVEGRLEFVGDLPASDAARLFMDALRTQLASCVPS